MQVRAKIQREAIDAVPGLKAQMRWDKLNDVGTKELSAIMAYHLMRVREERAEMGHVSDFSTVQGLRRSATLRAKVEREKREMRERERKTRDQMWSPTSPTNEMYRFAAASPKSVVTRSATIDTRQMSERIATVFSKQAR